MQFSVTIPDGEYYQIQSETNTVNLLELTNDGPAALYYGRRVPAITATGSTESGSPVITLTEYTGRPLQGMDVTGTGIAASSRVLSVNGNAITLDKNATATGVPTNLSFQATLDDITGVPIEVGVTKSFSPAIYRQFLQQGFDLYALGAGDAAVRIFKITN